MGETSYSSLEDQAAAEIANGAVKPEAPAAFVPDSAVTLPVAACDGCCGECKKDGQ